jgi:GTP-binding protein EngB required for normal cell division
MSHLQRQNAGKRTSVASLYRAAMLARETECRNSGRTNSATAYHVGPEAWMRR